MWYHELATPAAVVDRQVIESNARRMAACARQLGVRLRPHIKTHKCPEIARLQVAETSGGICVSTLAEARGFAAAGFDDLVYGVPVAPSKLDQAAEIRDGVGRLALVFDHPRTLAAIQEHGAARGSRWPVLLEVDCGAHRCGVDPLSPQAVELAVRAARSSSVELCGLFTHAGHAYRCLPGEVAAVAAQERQVMVRLAQRLEQEGVRLGEISIGSTPTMAVAEDLSGITEVRPGNYIFGDAFQVAIGACRLDQVSFSVLTTVVGVYPDRNELVIDAGALALSKDPGPTLVDPDCGYGVVVPAEGGLGPFDLCIVALTQEHGVVRAKSGARVCDFEVGQRLRVIPNHSCLAAALFERFAVVSGGDLEGFWQPLRGW